MTDSVSSLGRIGLSAVAGALAACTLGLALLARAEGPAHALRAASAPPAVAVAYRGPRGTLSGLVRLRASATSRGARIVAVTYLLDGSPLGSVTSAPYTLDVKTGLLPRGRHTLRVAAVDGLGRSATGASVPVRTTAELGPVVRASPGRGLNRALSALRAGATVLLGPGRYVVEDAVLGSGARLIGSGPRTIIAAPATSYFSLLSVKGSGVRISHLTIDGGGQGGGRGFAVAIADGSSDVRLQRVRMLRVRGDGVNVWGSHSNVSVQDSVIDGGGRGDAGVRALESDRSGGVSVIRTEIRNFRGYGIDFAQSAYGRRTSGMHALALDNRISDIRDPARAACRSAPRTAGCGTNEAGIESGAVAAAIIGNTIKGAAWDGVETVGSSTRTTVVANTISRTRTGIYLEHATNRTVVARNLVSDVRTGINVEWRYGGVGSRQNAFWSNRIVRAAKTGLFLDVGADENTVTRNEFVAGARPAIVMQGSSLNLVRRNRACEPAGPLVRQQTGRFDDGRPAHATRNRIDHNVGDDSCRGS
jgi:hypothetical protein